MCSTSERYEQETLLEEQLCQATAEIVRLRGALEAIMDVCADVKLATRIKLTNVPEALILENISLRTLLRRVDALKFSVRAQNGLRHSQIFFFGDLVQKTELDILRIKNCGRKTLKEIKEALTEHNLRLGLKFGPDFQAQFEAAKMSIPVH